MHRGPDRGIAHHEIAVAADRHCQTARAFERQRGADRNARSAADAAAAVGTEEVERMAEDPPAVLPGDRQVRERRRPFAEDLAQRARDVLVGEAWRLMVCLLYTSRRSGFRPTRNRFILI